MRLRSSLPFLFVFSFFLNPLFALQIPKRPEGHVSDYAGIISSEVRSSLEEKLRQFEAETSSQVVVAAFPSLEGEALEDFSIRLAEQWKIGQKGKDNGVILLIFKDDRKVRIEVGYGLEGVLPDATAKLIIENEIVPRFREGKFDEGVEGAVRAILLATKGEYRGASPSPVGAYFGRALLVGIFLGALFPLLLLWPIFLLGIFFVAWALVHSSFISLFYALALGIIPLPFYYLFGRHLGGYSVLSRQGDDSGRGFFGGGFGGGGFGGGGFGGGFSGGGGGSFGGGGASGGW